MMRVFLTAGACILFFCAAGATSMANDLARRLVICIDPGHPSENNDGKELANGLREVSVNWEVAVLLKQELERDDFVVLMTKQSESEFVSNKDRAAVANNGHADLLLRLHADAGPGSALPFIIRANPVRRRA